MVALGLVTTEHLEGKDQGTGLALPAGRGWEVGAELAPDRSSGARTPGQMAAPEPGPPSAWLAPGRHHTDHGSRLLSRPVTLHKICLSQWRDRPGVFAAPGGEATQ